jgi:hypothetical protein
VREHLDQGVERRDVLEAVRALRQLLGQQAAMAS